MTHHEHPNVLEQVLELLAENGFDGMADALQAQPYERTGRRRGYANGFKSKVLQTRIGTIPLAIPHNRWLQQTVQKYHTSAPKLAEWLEANVPESLTVLRWPPAHRRRLRT
ncbi:MAG: transposase, partial [Planctomycetaceae bacterium]|nr:transposase [Planctomycetaceae bacterium]